MNIITTSGRLTKDAEIRQTKTSDNGYVLFTLASNFIFGDRATKAQSEGQPTAIFYSVMCFGDYYVNSFSDLKKGDLVTVVGDLSISEYTNDSGEKFVSHAIKPMRIEVQKTSNNTPSLQDDDKPW